jgi:uncharacterized protein YjbI with pentapeptide repeats
MGRMQAKWQSLTLPRNVTNARNKTWSSLSQVLWFVGILGLYLLLGGVLFGFLEHYVNPDAINDSSKKVTARKDLVQALGFLMVGVAGAIGIYFTWRGQRLTQESLEDTRKNTEDEQKLTHQGQITERFTQGIKQLGDDKLEVRIGGIYALAKIAEDSDIYYWPIIEILAAYVRKNAPWTTTEASESGEDSDHEEDLEHMSLRRRLAYAMKLDKSATSRRWQHAEAGEGRSHQHKQLDIQAILYILRNLYKLRDCKHPNDNGEDFIRLTDTDLRYADLREMHLERARLRGANLKEARLGSAHLSEARLRNTIFVKADLEKAQLQDADLEQAILCKAELQGANLQGADLERANLQGANLQGANLRKANLQDAKLQGAILEGALFRGALLQGAILEGALLRGALLQGALLQEADLQGAYQLIQEQIEGAIGSNETTLPEGLNRPQLWSKSIEEQTKIVP